MPPLFSPAGRLVALFLIGQFGLMATAIVVLGGAIDWPASLRYPASVVLPKLVEHEGAVMFGYGCYLASALLLVPAAAALSERLNLSRGLAGASLAFAALSAIAKAIGIGRWLLLMPGLAHAYQKPGADTATLSLLFDVFNLFAGGIGEVLGVGLFAGIWTLIVAWALLMTSGLASRTIGVFLLCGGVALLATAAQRFGLELGSSFLVIANTIWQLGMLTLGVWAAFKPAPLDRVAGGVPDLADRLARDGVASRSRAPALGVNIGDSGAD